jgi:ABC-2 type transport system permease protein
MAEPVLFRRAVSERRRWLLGWSIGVAALIVVTVAFWPTLRGRADELNKAMESMPDSLRSLFGLGGGVDPFSPVGYLSSKVFAMTLPLLLLIAGIGLAAAPSGDEEHGLLETTYTLPIRRRGVVLQRWTAMVALVAALAGVGLVTSTVSSAIVGIDVSTTGLVWACVAAAALAWAVAGIATVVGAFTGRRGMAITVSAVVAVVSYLVTSLADAGIDVFRTLRPVSLFTHYDVVRILVVGRPSWHLLVLVAVAAVCPAVAAWAVERRDLRAG